MQNKYCITGYKINDEKVVFVIDSDGSPMVFVDKHAATDFMVKNGISIMEINSKFKFYKPDYMITGVLVEVEDQLKS